MLTLHRASPDINLFDLVKKKLSFLSLYYEDRTLMKYLALYFIHSTRVLYMKSYSLLTSCTQAHSCLYTCVYSVHHSQKRTKRERRGEREIERREKERLFGENIIDHPSLPVSNYFVSFIFFRFHSIFSKSVQSDLKSFVKLPKKKKSSKI